MEDGRPQAIGWLLSFAWGENPKKNNAARPGFPGVPSTVLKIQLLERYLGEKERALAGKARFCGRCPKEEVVIWCIVEF